MLVQVRPAGHVQGASGSHVMVGAYPSGKMPGHISVFRHFDCSSAKGTTLRAYSDAREGTPELKADRARLVDF